MLSGANKLIRVMEIVRFTRENFSSCIGDKEAERGEVRTTSNWKLFLVQEK